LAKIVKEKKHIYEFVLDDKIDSKVCEALMKSMKGRKKKKLKKKKGKKKKK